MKVWLNCLMKFNCKCFPKFHLMIQEQQASQLQREKLRKASYPQKESLKNTEFVSSSNQEEHLAKLFGASVAGYSTEPRFLLGSMDRVSTNGHISEKRNRKSFLFSRDINEQFSTEDNETLQEAVRTDILQQTHIIFLY
uniref:Uncharacterized protein n=1 Tax=Lynx canadensis TaxID=61383 RepID=A0A667GS70_LYNCA